MKVYGLRFDDKLDDHQMLSLLSCVEDHKRERIQKFVHWEDVQRTLLGDLFIRYLIIGQFRIPNHKISFLINEACKPRINHIDHFHFNLSHSGNWIVCAGGTKSVGIDIQKILPVDLDIGKHFCSPEEYQRMMAYEPYDRNPFFFRLWTLKESYLKYVGSGLRFPLHAFTIRFLQNGEVVLANGTRISRDILFRSYDIDPQYKMAVCTSQTILPDSITIFGLQEIICFFMERH